VRHVITTRAAVSKGVAVDPPAEVLKEGLVLFVNLQGRDFFGLGSGMRQLFQSLSKKSQDAVTSFKAYRKSRKGRDEAQPALEAKNLGVRKTY
jgi:hypothetical protein